MIKKNYSKSSLFFLIVIFMIAVSLLNISCKIDSTLNPNEDDKEEETNLEDDSEENEIFDYSIGLSYKLEADGYYVTGVGACKDEFLIIPDIYFEKPVVGVATDAFRNNSKIKSVNLPTTVKIIRKRAFLNCTSLSTVNFEDCILLHTIEEKAFSRCENLSQLLMTNSIAEIEDEAFSGCAQLSYIEPSQNLYSLGRDVFIDTSWHQEQIEGIVYLGSIAYGLKLEGTSNEFAQLKLKEGCFSIANYAFYENTSIQSINLPSTLGYIGYFSLQGCPNLTSIDVSPDNDKFYSKNNCLLTLDQDLVKLLLGCKNSTIPQTVNTIEKYAFYNAKDLAYIAIPNSVSSIGQGAFKKCTSLDNIQVNIVEIEEETFWGSANLKSFWVSEDVLTIKRAAFYDCELLSTVFLGSEHVLAALRGITSGGNLLENVEVVYIKESLASHINAFVTASFERMQISDYEGYIKFSREGV